MTPLGRWGWVCGTVKIGGRDGTGEGIGPREKGFPRLADTPPAGPVSPVWASSYQSRLPVPVLVKVVLGHGLRLGGIELGGLIEAVRGETRCELFGVGTTETEEELSLGGAGGGM